MIKKLQDYSNLPCKTLLVLKVRLKMSEFVLEAINLFEVNNENKEQGIILVTLLLNLTRYLLKKIFIPRFLNETLSHLQKQLKILFRLPASFIFPTYTRMHGMNMHEINMHGINNKLFICTKFYYQCILKISICYANWLIGLCDFDQSDRSV